ncbi:MAG TPA: VWA domain-containing protein [Kofleriaceae bacterium]|jgi:hypothetical protein
MLWAVAAVAISTNPPEATLVSVHAELHGDRATLAAHYKVTTVRGVSENAIPFTLPIGAVLTDATISGAGGSHRLALDTAEHATAAYTGATADDAGAYGWAMRIAMDDTQPTLSIVAPGAYTLDLALTIDVETCYRSDARYVELPEDYFALIDHKLEAPTAHQGEIGEACTGSDVNHGWIEFPATDLAQRKPGGDRIGAMGTAVSTSSGQIARVELAAAGAIGEIPADLATVILVDTSRSIDDAGRMAEADLVGAYLAAAPNSRVQVIGYARRADPILPGWTDAREAASELRQLVIDVPATNGSEPVVALAMATDWLARTGGTKRILILTDDALAEHYGSRDDIAHDLGKLVPPGVLVHAVSVEPAADLLERDDAGLFGALAEKTGGMAVRGGGPITKIDATLLVRPISLDHVELEPAAWTAHSFPEPHACVDSLAAGASCAWWLESPIGGPVTINGDIWGTHVTRVVVPDPAGAPELARMIVANDPAADGDIALAAHAVDARWSLIATWGGHRGYEGMALASDMMSHSFDTAGTMSSMSTHCGGTSHTPVLDLAPQLAAGVRACAPRDAHVSIDVETTLQEIVDVTVTLRGPEGERTDRSLASCIESAVWATPLELHGTIPSHAHTRVQF